MKMNTDLIKKYDMLPNGARVLCAVSGGADSMCLLHFLHSKENELGIRVFAAHFNHRLRGEEADRDERFVAAWCRERGIDCVTGSGDVKHYAEQKGQSIEEAARELRYKFLFETMQKLDCTLIATAHNADDNAETMLFNLARGAGAKGLGGIPPKRGVLVRPLLGTTRDEIEAYLAENAVPHVEDSTNASDDYTRNRLRHSVMPVLREINPAFSASAMRAAESLREDEAFLQSLAENFIVENFSDKRIDRRKFNVLARPVQKRVLRTLCGRALTTVQSEAIISISAAQGTGCTDVHGLRVTASGDSISFGETASEFADTEIIIGAVTEIPDTDYTVCAQIVNEKDKVFNSLNTFFFNCDAICGTIFFTSRKNGDKLRLRARGCTKSLKDLFSERKMTSAQKVQTPVLRDEKGIIAVSGFGIAERCEPDGADRLLKITINKK